MFWFNQPEEVNSRVRDFLLMEQEYLKGTWNFSKIMIAMLVPLSLSLLAAAFWKRNLWWGMVVMILIAAGKMVWSVSFGGESGKSIMIPALAGLVLCMVLVYWGFKRSEKNKGKNC